MEIEHKIICHAGNGSLGTVFVVEYQNNIAALKIQYGERKFINEIKELGDKEYGFLERLSGIKGVPKPIKKEIGLEGTFSELGLYKSGLELDDIVSKTPDQNEKDIYFSSGFLMDFMPHKMQLPKISAWRNHNINDIKLSKEFFDDLDKKRDEFYRRNLSFPIEGDILVGYDNLPIVLDFNTLTDLNQTNQRASYEQLGIEITNRIRKKFQK